MAYRKLSPEEKAEREAAKKRDEKYSKFGKHIKVLIAAFKENEKFFNDFKTRDINEEGLSNSDWNILSLYINKIKPELEKLNFLPLNFNEIPEVINPQIKKLSQSDIIMAKQHINGIAHAILNYEYDKDEEHVANLVYNHSIILMRDLQKQTKEK